MPNRRTARSQGSSMAAMYTDFPLVRKKKPVNTRDFGHKERITTFSDYYKNKMNKMLDY
jgi:hypothetical protein